MSRILAIDYGTKRTGIAVSDSLRIIATGLAQIHSKDVIDFLENYFRNEIVEIIVVGEPKTLTNKNSNSSRFIEPFVKHLEKKFAEKKIVRFDERFTTVIAKQSQLIGGTKKKQRESGENIDMISATIILQDYMKFIENKNEFFNS